VFFSLGENEENINTIQRPLLVFFSPSNKSEIGYLTLKGKAGKEPEALLQIKSFK